jgi:hypothetical protein
MSTGAANGKDFVNGWKEIAGAMGVSVRTAQRLEATAGLPIYRVGGKTGGVFALRRELQRWRETREELARAGAEQERRSALRVAAGALLGLWHRAL